MPSGFRGDFGEALRWFKRIFRKDQPEKQLPQESIGHLNVARLHLYRGEFEETEKHLERALELCQIYNLKALRGEIFEAYGNFYREKQDFPHASEFYERPLKAYDDGDINPATHEIDEERAKFYLLQNDLAKSRGLLENLIESRQKLNNEAGLFTAKFWLCKVRFAQGETANLSDEIRQIQIYFHKQNLFYDEALASFLLAETLFAAGERKKMIAPLQRTLDLSARFDYEFWLRGEILKNPEIFKDEEVFERLPLDLRQIVESGERRTESENLKLKMQNLNVSQLSTLYSPLTTLTDLSVNTLGFIEIFRDKTKPFAADAWTTRRSRDIFCFIATSKHRRVDKDILIDTFWGDEGFDAVEKNFHPTISHIRKALNSRQSFKQNFLVFRDGAYQLNGELSFSIDTEEFETAITEAENAKREKDSKNFRQKLETAHALYRGEFMAGIYDNWAEEKRHYYAEQFARVLNGLAKLSFTEKSWSNALKFAGEILKLDPYREDVHRLLMKIYAAQGKPASVKEQFETLRELLRKELGVEPAPETRKIFQELLK